MNRIKPQSLCSSSEHVQKENNVFKYSAVHNVDAFAKQDAAVEFSETIYLSRARTRHLTLEQQENDSGLLVKLMLLFFVYAALKYVTLKSPIGWHENSWTTVRCLAVGLASWLEEHANLRPTFLTE